MSSNACYEKVPGGNEARFACSHYASHILFREGSCICSWHVNLATAPVAYACTQTFIYHPESYLCAFWVSSLCFSFWFFSSVSLNLSFLNFWPHGKKITLKIRILQMAPLCLYHCPGECALFFTWELCSLGVPWYGKMSDHFFKNQLASAIKHRDAF